MFVTKNFIVVGFITTLLNCVHSNTIFLFGIRVVQFSGICYRNIKLWRIANVRMSNKITIFEFD